MPDPQIRIAAPPAPLDATALAEALRAVEARVPNARVVIVGDGDQRGWLQRQLPHAIFTGFLEGEELAEAYASSDLFVYPSTTDTFGNVTLEAMASGLAVVGADAPGTRSVVGDPRSVRRRRGSGGRDGQASARRFLAAATRARGVPSVAGFSLARDSRPVRARSRRPRARGRRRDGRGTLRTRTGAAANGHPFPGSVVNV